MILTLHTETTIDSSHQLRGYDGNCSRIHGHTWFVEVWVRGESSQVDEVGILWDFGNVKRLKEMYDHQFINDIAPFDNINPTAENLCQRFYDEVKLSNPSLEFKVRVYETAVGKQTWCECGDWD